MNISAILKKFYTVTNEAKFRVYNKPYMDDNYFYATQGRFMVRAKKDAHVEGLLKPPESYYDFDWGVFDNFDKKQSITRFDIEFIEEPLYECIECGGTGLIRFHNGFHFYTWDCNSCNGDGYNSPALVWKISDNVYCPIKNFDLITNIFGDIECLVTEKKDIIPFRFTEGEGFIAPSPHTDRDVFDPYLQKRLFVKKFVYGALHAAHRTRKNAETIARQYLSRKIGLRYQEYSTGVNLYGFDQENDYLFSFDLYPSFMTGGSNYIAVSKRSGKVTAVEYAGE